MIRIQVYTFYPAASRARIGHPCWRGDLGGRRLTVLRAAGKIRAIIRSHSGRPLSCGECPHADSTRRLLFSLTPKKGTGPICRDGPQGASHKLDLSPFSLLSATTHGQTVVVGTVHHQICHTMLFTASIRQREKAHVFQSCASFGESLLAAHGGPAGSPPGSAPKAARAPWVLRATRTAHAALDQLLRQ